MIIRKKTLAIYNFIIRKQNFHFNLYSNRISYHYLISKIIGCYFSNEFYIVVNYYIVSYYNISTY